MLCQSSASAAAVFSHETSTDDTAQFVAPRMNYSNRLGTYRNTNNCSSDDDSNDAGDSSSEDNVNWRTYLSTEASYTRAYHRSNSYGQGSNNFVQELETELEQQRPVLGPSHPKIAELATALGLYHQHVTGNFEESMRYHSEALRVHRSIAVFAPENGVSDVAIVLTDIGRVLTQAGRTEEAIEAYNEAMQIHVTHGLGDEHPRVSCTLRGIALLTRITPNARESFR